MESSKAIQEQIDALAIEAKALIATAKRESRELSTEEAERFDAITKTEIVGLKAKLTTALNREEEVLKLSNENRRNASVAELDEMLNSPTREPRTVLPVNGRLSGEPQEDRIFVRQAKLKAFKNERDAFDAGMWIRAIAAKEQNKEDVKALQHCQRRNGLFIGNTAYEYSGPQGGYLVPAQISQTIIDVRENVGVARQVCEVMPMSGDTLTVPKRSSGMTVYAPGETNAITTSDKTWKHVELINKKRAVAAYISQELVDDALISIVDNIISEMGYSLALQEDNELINGTGANTTYFGVTGLKSSIGTAGVSTAATGHDTWPELDVHDFAACIGLLPERFNRNPSWICSSNFYNGAMLNVAYSGGGNTIATLTEGARGNRTFLGYPVYVTSQMPLTTAAATVCALFGSFDMGVILGDRMGIRFGRDDSSQFLSDLTTLKATVRYDIKVHQPGDSSNAGAYVALKTAS